jgi:signal transduction histidine kinase
MLDIEIFNTLVGAMPPTEGSDMSTVRANEVHAVALAAESREFAIPGTTLFSWFEGRLRDGVARNLTRRISARVSLRWLLPGWVLAAFVADACAPLGVALWLLHAVPLALSHRGPHARLPYALAAASTLLILLAWFLATSESSGSVDAFNRAAFAGVLWLAAVWVVRHKAAERALKASEARSLQLSESLEQRVCERTAQLEAANKELDAFACSVSHDLRAPLRAVDGFAQILEEEHASQLGEEGRRTLGVVRSEARRMSGLINDLLDFSRLGKHEIRLSDTDMTGLVRELFDQVKGRAADRNVDFRLGELPAARADSALLRQVWFNLLDNALKYTRKRRRVEIRVDGTRQGSELVYSIRDNGAGFDMKYADRLFGVFQRLHGSEEFEGTGVGLALVQSIIRRHGGRVWAEAQVERGATFYFTLPTPVAAAK